VRVGRPGLIVANAILGVLLLTGLSLSIGRVLPGGNVVRGGEPSFGLEPLLTITGPASGQFPEFLRPTGVAFGPEGEVLVVDAGNNRVVMLAANGRSGTEFGGFGVVRPLAGSEPAWSAGRFNNPAGIEVSEDGTMYVADPRNNHVQVFDREGTFLRRFPDPEAGMPRSSDSTSAPATPMDIAVAGGLVYVADVSRLLVFDEEGRFVREFSGAGPGEAPFVGVTGVAATDEGRVYVADSGSGRVVAMTSHGEVLWSVGSDPVDSDSPGEPDPATYRFGLPYDVAVMDEGTVAVLDSLDSTIVLFTEDGEFIGRYGVRGPRPAEFNDPGGIDARGDLLLVADTGNNRVQIVKATR